MNPIRTTLLADCLSGARSVGPSMSVRARDRVEGGDDEDDGDAGKAADQGDDDCDDRANWRDRVLTGDGARLRVGYVLLKEPSVLRAIPPDGIPGDRDEEEVDRIHGRGGPGIRGLGQGRVTRHERGPEGRPDDGEGERP